MDPRTLLNALAVAEGLKDTTRHSYTSQGRRESVAEHSWMTALMAYLMKDEFPQADMNKVMEMCLLHDLGEAFVGDIPSFEKTPGQEQEEEARFFAWVDTLPPPYGAEMAGLYREMATRETVEAKIFKAIDNLEAVIQHNRAPLSTWIPLEYELNQTYGADKAAFSPYLAALREAVRQDTLDKLEQER